MVHAFRSPSPLYTSPTPFSAAARSASLFVSRWLMSLVSNVSPMSCTSAQRRRGVAFACASPGTSQPASADPAYPNIHVCTDRRMGERQVELLAIKLYLHFGERTDSTVYSGPIILGCGYKTGTRILFLLVGSRRFSNTLAMHTHVHIQAPQRLVLVSS